MKKHFFYSIAICIAFFIFSLTSCERIDDKNVSPNKLLNIEDVLKNNDFTNLMGIRNVINDRIANKGIQKKPQKELSEAKTKDEYEILIKEMGFKSLKEYNEILFIERYYLNRLKENILNIDLLNQANKKFLENKQKIDLAKLKNSRLASSCDQCQFDYIISVISAGYNRDIEVNSCNNSLPLNIQACPFIYFPDREWCYQEWNPFGSNTIFISCYTIPAGYYQDDNCIYSAYANNTNCVNGAITIYNSRIYTQRLLRNICLNAYGCPSRWD